MNSLKIICLSTFTIFLGCTQSSLNILEESSVRSLKYKINPQTHYNIFRDIDKKLDSCFYTINGKVYGSIFVWDFENGLLFREYGYWSDTFCYIKEYKYSEDDLFNINQKMYYIDEATKKISKRESFNISKSEIDSGNYFLPIVPHFSNNFSGELNFRNHDSSIAVGRQRFAAGILMDSLENIQLKYNYDDKIIISSGGGFAFPILPFQDDSNLFLFGMDFFRGHVNYESNKLIWKRNTIFSCFIITSNRFNLTYPNFDTMMLP